jgi:hypothetical protein
MIDAIVSMYYDTKAEMLGGAASRLLELQSQVVNFKYSLYTYHQIISAIWLATALLRLF